MNHLPFSEHRIKITDLVAEGDQVAIRVETRGVHSGEWEGVPPTGKRWTNRGMALARLEGGKIVELEFLFDELGLVLEPSGASGVAAIIAHRARLQSQLVATILCGGNALDEHRRWLVRIRNAE